MQVRKKDNGMQMPDSYVGADDNPELPSGKGRTQAFEQILSTSRTAFYGQAYRLLGNAADAEDINDGGVTARLAPLQGESRNDHYR
jgi:hypothetical protein